MGPCALVLDTADLEYALRQSQGRPPLHTDVRLVRTDNGEDAGVDEDGEIWVRGPSVTVGYWRRDYDDYFAPGGWLRTGDVARRDAGGYHYFTGRTKEMYKSGGENVYPAEVELVLINDPRRGRHCRRGCARRTSPGVRSGTRGHRCGRGPHTDAGVGARIRFRHGWPATSCRSVWFWSTNWPETSPARCRARSCATRSRSNTTLDA